jgi:Na+/H+ antiporter NhaD/arsenite permease-like protein
MLKRMLATMRHLTVPILTVCTILLFPALAQAADPTGGSAHAGDISLAWSIPFILLLACIALGPLLFLHFWEKYYPLLAIGFAIIPTVYYFFIRQDAHPWVHAMKDYVSFIILLGALFVVSGGILIRISRAATPMQNTMLLAFGAVLSNIVGTTGASMLLIRPYLRINRAHIRPFHVIFFIFIVSNLGGALTPIGDPPLFLGYLTGVPFWWVLEHCWPMWMVGVGLLLVIFFIMDRIDHGKTPRRDPDDAGPGVGLMGVHNLLFVLLIIFAVFRTGIFDVIDEVRRSALTASLALQMLLSREVLMLAAIVGSRLTTGRHIYEKNEFTWAPIREVALLFVGIFATMAPALQWLDTNANKLPLHTPGQYYYSTGTLSSLLDNAPTYMTFLRMEMAKLDPDQVGATEALLREIAEQKSDAPLMNGGIPGEVRLAAEEVLKVDRASVMAGVIDDQTLRVSMLVSNPKLNDFLIAISLGAVFFGACTYIGNGPNFMVKSVAESAGVKMPGFIGYVVRYTLPILLPVLVLVWLIFFVLL